MGAGWRGSGVREPSCAEPEGGIDGGGVNADNEKEYLDAGASHVIVTSYVFKDGVIQFDRLQKLVDLVGQLADKFTLHFVYMWLSSYRKK